MTPPKPSPTPTLKLKHGREKSARLRHPWIFAGAVDSLAGSPGSGDTVVVRSATGEFLGRAAYSSKSQIVARVWSFDEAEEIDAAFFERRLRTAASARANLTARTNARRWVNAESDGLPGVILDQYGPRVVAQLLSAGADRWRAEIAAAAASFPGVEGVFEKSDAAARAKEGLGPSEGLIAGREPEGDIEVWEAVPESARAALKDGLWRFGVDPAGGQKTGFFLDQRENRRRVAEAAAGRVALDAFCYTGAFTVAALSGGAASVESLDSSPGAVEMARRNLERNGFAPEGPIQADVFKRLRELREGGPQFDMIILDPPKFAASRSQVDKAARAYKDINWLALRLLRPGGLLFTFSCSGAVTPDLFQKILFGAAIDAGRDARIVDRMTQASDHPVALPFPEGDYLKGLCLWVA